MIAVSMTKEKWEAVIRLMYEGDCEGSFYVGRREENNDLIESVCSQTGITWEDAMNAEPERLPYPSSAAT